MVKQDQILKFIIKKVITEIFIKIKNYNENTSPDNKLALKRKSSNKLVIFNQHKGNDKHLDFPEFKKLLKTIDFTINYIDIIHLIHETLNIYQKYYFDYLISKQEFLGQVKNFGNTGNNCNTWLEVDNDDTDINEQFFYCVSPSYDYKDVSDKRDKAPDLCREKIDGMKQCKTGDSGWAKDGYYTICLRKDRSGVKQSLTDNEIKSVCGAECLKSKSKEELEAISLTICQVCDELEGCQRQYDNDGNHPNAPSTIMTSLTGRSGKDKDGLHTDVKICSLDDTSTARDCIGVPGVTNLKKIVEMEIWQVMILYI